MRLTLFVPCADLAGFCPGPGCVPFAHPELQLLLLRGGARIRRRLRSYLLSKERGNGEQRENQQAKEFCHGSPHPSDAASRRTLCRWRPGAVSGTSNSLTLETIVFLFFAGALGGALNSVAGGGSFIAFPALLFTGVPPIPANATNTIALWTGAAASGGAYRKQLDVPRRVMIPLLAASLVGGLAGAFLLLKTPAHTFMRVLPVAHAGRNPALRLRQEARWRAPVRD